MTTEPLEQSIPVAVSARHVHLSQATIERLFGPDHEVVQVAVESAGRSVVSAML
jgi:propanediol utilization protein